MVDVRPADAGLPLPRMLQPGRGAVGLPVLALGAEEQVAGPVRAELGHGGIDQAFGVVEPARHVVELATPGAEALQVHSRGTDRRRRHLGHLAARVAVALDRDQVGAGAAEHPRATIRAMGRALDDCVAAGGRQ